MTSAAITPALVVIAALAGLLVGGLLTIAVFVLAMRWRPRVSVPSVPPGTWKIAPASDTALDALMVPSGATEERQSKAAIIEKGAGAILSEARALGISMTAQEARDHAALMVGEAGL